MTKVKEKAAFEKPSGIMTEISARRQRQQMDETHIIEVGVRWALGKQSR
jgi:hypothetical protein